MSEHSDPFILSLFCRVKMTSARSMKSLSVESVLAETCAGTLSDEPSYVVSESDDDDNVANESYSGFEP
jgi:hypothetical protein